MGHYDKFDTDAADGDRQQRAQERDRAANKYANRRANRAQAEQERAEKIEAQEAGRDAAWAGRAAGREHGKKSQSSVGYNIFSGGVDPDGVVSAQSQDELRRRDDNKQARLDNRQKHLSQVSSGGINPLTGVPQNSCKCFKKNKKAFGFQNGWFFKLLLETNTYPLPLSGSDL